MMECGEQCVITIGTLQMQLLYVDNLDTPLQVTCIPHLYYIIFADIIGAQASINAVFGQGITSSPILLSGVSCISLESSLFDCPNADLNYINNCGHQQDAGVQCKTAGNTLGVRRFSFIV